jgi:hypothetical protein
MNIKWNVNGIVIQSIDRSDLYCQTKTPYLGVGRYHSWPLETDISEESKLLTQEANDEWFSFYYGSDQKKYALEVIPSFDYIKAYSTLCSIKKISIRAICIETERKVPLWQGPELKKHFLGFDYATSTDFFSTLYDDLYTEETHYLLYKYKTKINSYGLFSEEKDLIMYIQDREKALLDGYDLESDGYFCAMKIYEVDSSLWL